VIPESSLRLLIRHCISFVAVELSAEPYVLNVQVPAGIDDLPRGFDTNLSKNTGDVATKTVLVFPVSGYADGTFESV